MRTVGSHSGHTREAPKSNDVISKPTDNKKPESVFNQNDITENQTSISTIQNELENNFDITEVFQDLFKSETKENNPLSFEIIPSNFAVVNNRIKGTVNVKSNEKTFAVYRLHTFFSPLDLKQKIFGQKINDLHFKSDFSETIQINESAKNYKNVSIKIHVMSDNGKVIGQEIFLDVQQGDTQDMPVKAKSDNTAKYVIAIAGLIGLALIFKRIRKQ
jgi:hypothetical protein